MDSLPDVFNLEKKEYMKINITLYSCKETEDDNSSDRFITDFKKHVETNAGTKTPLLQNLLGDSLFSNLQSLFGPKTDDHNGLNNFDLQASANCDTFKSVEVSFIPVNVAVFILTFVIAALILIFITCQISRCFKRKSSSKTKVNEVKETTNQKTADLEGDPETESRNIVEQCIASDKDDLKSFREGSHLSYQCRVQKEVVTQAPGTAVTTFLERTSDKLFKKLDNLLLRNLADGQSLTQTCPATPRLAQRNPLRRQRMSSSPALQSLPSQSETQRSTINEDEDAAWESFVTFSQNFCWKYPSVSKVEARNYDQLTMKLLHYFDRVCQIPRNMWETSTLLTNYVLYLLSTEMNNAESKTGYRFIEFRRSGSGSVGTKVARPSQFDVLMVLQPPVTPDSVFGSSCENIPPGMVMVSVNTAKLHSIEKKIACNAEMEGKYRLFLSVTEFATSAESLVEDCLQALYTRSRSAMDRLPFQVKGAPTGTLSININTRALVGFGEADVKINIIPVLPLPLNGWYQTPMLYATRALGDLEQHKKRTESRNGINPDLLWQLSTGEFESVFDAGVNSMMKHANINSCHTVCLLILKGLLTAGGKNNLLDRGVFQSYHLSAVISFLLLESAPNQWSFDKLADRFSDAVHFLRAAYGNGRLPHFFVNNPHLISKMPAVADNKVLIQKRQKNLLLDMKRESLEKNLQYLDTVLHDSGLTECVKEEFSIDMWEYEFFIFN